MFYLQTPDKTPKNTIFKEKLMPDAIFILLFKTFGHNQGDDISPPKSSCKILSITWKLSACDRALCIVK